MSKAIRSLRNNNPGNLRVGQPWRGLMPRSQMTAEQKAETAFTVFQTPAYGFRALCKVLLAYQLTHGLHTIDQIIHRWAPPSENNTGGYVSRVCALTGKERAERIDLKDPDTLRTLAKAIATVEAGGWVWLDDDLQKGVEEALQ